MQSAIDDSLFWSVSHDLVAACHCLDGGILISNNSFELGNKYTLTGEHETAFHCFAHAAKIGHLIAQHTLGDCYERGIGVTKNRQSAMFWYTKAVDAGHTDAMYALGCIFEDGMGTDVNMNNAIDWYIKAANAGHTDAMYALGCISDAHGALAYARVRQNALTWRLNC
jgi:hypothetical protein